MLPELADETRARLAELLPAEASAPTRSTCSARPSPTRTRAALPLVLADPGVDAVIALFVLTVVADAEDGRGAIERAAAQRREARRRR